MKKIENYIFTTKLGHFLALFTIAVLLELLFLPIYPDLFIYAVAGSFITAVIISLRDNNKQWF